MSKTYKFKTDEVGIDSATRTIVATEPVSEVPATTRETEFTYEQKLVEFEQAKVLEAAAKEWRESVEAELSEIKKVLPLVDPYNLVCEPL